MEKRQKGQLIVLSGPSGVGKSTVISQLLRQRGDIHFSVSFTTRAPRDGERHGVHYNFVDHVEFQRMIACDELLEFAQYVGNYYGTSMKVIREKLDAGIDVLLDIEVQGAAKVKARCPEAVLIFIAAPSFEELSRRLRTRRTDGEEAISRRLDTARSEYGQICHYDYVVVNDRVETAAGEIFAILVAERCRTCNRIQFLEGV